MIPFVIGRGWNALWQIRMLGREGIPVIHGWSSRSDISMFSRYGQHILLPDYREEPDRAVEVINSLAQDLVLLDYWPGWYEFLASRDDVDLTLPMIPNVCLNKADMYEYVAGIGIKIPLTVFIDSLTDMSQAALLPPPYVLKPQEKQCLSAKALKIMDGRPAVFLRDFADLQRVASRLLAQGIDFSTVVQEYIPGPVTNLYTVMAFSSDRRFIGVPIQKLRQYPARVGTIVAGKMQVPSRHIFTLTRKLLSSLGYVGLSNTEFKYDYRDGAFKFIEINPGLGKSHGAARACGVEFPVIKYDWTWSRQLPFPKCDAAVWVDWAYDIKNCFLSEQKMYNLSLREWWRSLKGKKVPAVLCKDDPIPFFVHLWKVFHP